MRARVPQKVRERVTTLFILLKIFVVLAALSTLAVGAMIALLLLYWVLSAVG